MRAESQLQAGGSTGGPGASPLWVKLPGESTDCKGRPGTFTASLAYDVASSDSSS
ncbi:hypothetical protein [Streptomyces tibetensis]|uniref:hypothetical protein n=1 Tax=Streptomyces tibetensis TaxID=2382123 RepID=UPI0033EC893C